MNTKLENEIKDVEQKIKQLKGRRDKWFNAFKDATDRQDDLCAKSALSTFHDFDVSYEYWRGVLSGLTFLKRQQ